MSLMLALLLAQAGPSVSGGAGPALPQAPLELRRKREQSASAPPPPPLSRTEQCLVMVSSAPLDALATADDWLRLVKGSALVDPALCKALALSALARWDEAEAAFMMARDAVPANELARRAKMGAGAGLAADEAGATDRALDLLDAAQADAVKAADPALAGKIALDRAGLLDKLGRPGDTAAALAQARVALPGNSDTWLISARFSRKQGQLAQAQTQIEQAAQLRPVDAEIGLEAGVIAVLSGRDEAARRSWKSVIAIAPGSEIAKQAQSYLDQLGPDPAPMGR